MSHFENSALWKKSLGARRNDVYEEQRSRLRHAYLQMRGTVAPLAAEIAITMPSFTDHSIIHADSLWEVASLIAGADYDLSPLEGFVLGCAMLVHDIGMGLAAYPRGSKQLHETKEYLAYIALLQNLEPDASEEDLRARAQSYALRTCHARQAESLMTQKFKGSREGEDFYLLADTALRSRFGRLIGKIASSHWENADDLPSLFEVILGSCDDFPDQWEIDPLKIACLLRVADAAHVDSRRAPMLTRSFRSPEGISAQHWCFQERMNRPRVNDDRLEYTSADGFTIEEIDAWWLAFDTLKMVSHEIRSVDSILADLGRPRFQVRSVAGVENPARFSRYIPTSKWVPIDATVCATDAARVVRHLGGEALYGAGAAMSAVRELLANAIDASLARAAALGDDIRPIEISLVEEQSSWVLRVRDYGIGMAAQEMVSNLLDFGTSSWMSPDRIEAYPEIFKQGFTSIGKFGIGFFSVFMLGDKVSVRSLACKDAAVETCVLEFNSGVDGRPVLRPAKESEQLRGGGTEVLVYLKHHPKSENGLFRVGSSKVDVLDLFAGEIIELAALSEVDIRLLGFKGIDGETLVSGGAWRTMPASQLFELIYERTATSQDDPEYEDMMRAYRNVFESDLEDIFDSDGRLVGRAVLACGLDEVAPLNMWWWPSPRAGIYVGGLKADSIPELMGVFVGDTVRADRGTAFPVAETDILCSWMASQAQRHARASYATPRSRLGAGQFAMSLGFPSEFLPCGLVREGEISPGNLRSWIAGLSRIEIIPQWEVQIFYDDEGGGVAFADRVRGRRLTLHDSSIVLDVYPLWIYPDEVLKRPNFDAFEKYCASRECDWDPARWWFMSQAFGSARMVLEAAAEAWNVDLVKLGLSVERKRYLGDGNDDRIRLPFEKGGGEARVDAFVLRRPF